jgi:hypothetical protein
MRVNARVDSCSTTDALLAKGDAARDWAAKAREACRRYNDPTSPSIAAADPALRRAG